MFCDLNCVLPVLVEGYVKSRAKDGMVIAADCPFTGPYELRKMLNKQGQAHLPDPEPLKLFEGFNIESLPIKIIDSSPVISWSGRAACPRLFNILLSLILETRILASHKRLCLKSPKAIFHSHRASAR